MPHTIVGGESNLRSFSFMRLLVPETPLRKNSGAELDMIGVNGEEERIGLCEPKFSNRSHSTRWEEGNKGGWVGGRV